MNRYASPQVGYGVGGAPVRYTHGFSSAGRRLGGSGAGEGEEDGPTSPLAPSPVAPLTTTATEAADGAAGRAGATSPVVPEFGMRYVDSGERFSVGGHVGVTGGLLAALAARRSGAGGGGAGAGRA